MVYANFGGQRECIMGNSKTEHTENNNLTAIPHGELQEFYNLNSHEEKMDTKKNLNTLPYIELQEFQLL